MAGTTRISVNFSSPSTSAANPLAPLQALIADIFNMDFASGVAAGQADVVYANAATILTAATLSLDLKGGGLFDIFGVALNPVKLKALYIKSRNGNTTNLTLLGDANGVPILNTAATTSTLQPGGVFLYTAPPLAGVAVTAGTGDIIKIVNAAGASALVDIFILGTSA